MRVRAIPGFFGREIRFLVLFWLAVCQGVRKRVWVQCYIEEYDAFGLGFHCIDEGQ